MAKDEEYRVQVNAVFIMKGKDKMDALGKVTQAISLLRPAGCVDREIKWSGVVEPKGAPPAPEKV
jgi:hypothetical protein